MRLGSEREGSLTLGSQRAYNASWPAWFVNRVLVPLGVAAASVVTLGGKDSVAAVILFPMLALVWTMFRISQERPADGEREPAKRLRCERNWHALTLLSLLVLMFFQGAVAAMAQDRHATLQGWALMMRMFLVPYAAISACAHAYLRKAARTAASSRPLGTGREGP